MLPHGFINSFQMFALALFIDTMGKPNSSFVCTKLSKESHQLSTMLLSLQRRHLLVLKFNPFLIQRLICGLHLLRHVILFFMIEAHSSMQERFAHLIGAHISI
jgi:hypothetical protein